jgi:[NiFe] hydrogenase assembly HybE family chaperone
MPECRDSIERLQAAFARIHAARMGDVPILNSRLKVEAVGTRSWNGSTLTVLVTPWFINLMLLPAADDIRAAWTALPIGTSMMHRFPAGRFDFLIGEEDEIGRYQMCSLFSPVLEFEDHEAARLAAAAALQALFDASLDPSNSSAKVAEGAAARAAAGMAPPADREESRSAQEPTRRGFLKGKVASREGPAS